MRHLQPTAEWIADNPDKLENPSRDYDCNPEESQCILTADAPIWTGALCTYLGRH